MGKNTFIPPMPHIEPPSQESIDQLQRMTKEDREQFKKSPEYRKYVQPVIDRRNKAKNQLRLKWWKENWIALLGLIFAFTAALPVILQGVETILKWLE